MKRLRGFTLIELMIVVVVVAILAAIAIPAWQRYAYRSRRPDGQELLIRIAQAEERYYTNYNRYPVSLSSIGFNTDPAPSEHGYYTATIALPAGDAAGTGFIATATPVPGLAQENDVCGPLSIDNTGDKQPDITKAAQNTNGPCWAQ